MEWRLGGLDESRCHYSRSCAGYHTVAAKMEEQVPKRVDSYAVPIAVITGIVGLTLSNVFLLVVASVCFIWSGYSKIGLKEKMLATHEKSEEKQFVSVKLKSPLT